MFYWDWALRYRPKRLRGRLEETFYSLASVAIALRRDFDAVRRRAASWMWLACLPPVAPCVYGRFRLLLAAAMTAIAPVAPAAISTAITKSAESPVFANAAFAFSTMFCSLMGSGFVGKDTL